MLSSLRLIGRLAWHNLRARPARAGLLLVTLSLATTVLSMALAVRETGNGAWDRLWHATNGPDVIASAGYLHPVTADTDVTWARDRLEALAAAPGVVASRWWYSQRATAEIGGLAMKNLTVRIADPTTDTLDQPLPTAGHWLDDGDGVVLEDALATALDVRPGDTVTIAGLRLPVRGAAMAVTAARYEPGRIPGTVWVNRATASRLSAAGVEEGGGFTVKLWLANHDDAQRFIEAHSSAAPIPGQVHEALPDGRVVEFDTWQLSRDHRHDDLDALAIPLVYAGIIIIPARSLATQPISPILADE